MKSWLRQARMGSRISSRPFPESSAESFEVFLEPRIWRIFRFCWWIGILFPVLLFAACAHPISESFRESVDETLTFRNLFEAPDLYSGRKVILGGEIVRTRNFPERTEIEVVQKKIDSWGYPDQGDETGGRFIFVSPDYLESEIYSHGRFVIGAGVVRGGKSGKVDERPYRFPVIEVKELHLWEAYPGSVLYPPYWNPFYPTYRPMRKR